MSSPSEAPVKPGDIIGGKYRVDRVLGAGGMGVVVAATHLVLNKPIAVKFLLPEAAKIPGVVQRFLREAQAASSLESEHVARVVDVGSLDSNTPFMVMEFLAGQDLEHVLHRQGALPITIAVDYILQACDALAEAHARGIVHRDLKPANLFLVDRKDGSQMVKVLDFGISKALHEAETGVSLTQTGGMLGSPLYMSPEQLSNPKGVDARTDIWSLGVVLYELLTRSLPFEGETIHSLAAVILTAPPPSLRSRRSEVSAELDAIVAACLEKERGRRYQTISDLAEALGPCAVGSGARVERISRWRRGSTPSLPDISSPSAPLEVSGSLTITNAPQENYPALKRPEPEPASKLATSTMQTAAGWGVTPPSIHLPMRSSWVWVAIPTVAVLAAAGWLLGQSATTAGTAASAPPALSPALPTAPVASSAPAVTPVIPVTPPTASAAASATSAPATTRPAREPASRPASKAAPSAPVKIYGGN